MEVFSPRATTPLALARLFDHRGVVAVHGADEPTIGVQAGQTPVPAPETPWKDGLTMPPARFNPAVLSDQELAESMVDELGRRGLSLVGTARGDEVRATTRPGVGVGHLYGRALPFTFEVS